MNRDATELLSLRRAASRLGVGGKWLREQAERGAVPGLRAGNRWLFDVVAVREVLRKMASESTQSKGDNRDPQ